MARPDVNVLVKRVYDVRAYGSYTISMELGLELADALEVVEAERARLADLLQRLYDEVPYEIVQMDAPLAIEVRAALNPEAGGG